MAILMTYILAKFINKLICMKSELMLFLEPSKKRIIEKNEIKIKNT
jgi:hypothetical protein